MEDTYEKAYKEVIELLKFFPKESVRKIPKEKLELYLRNMDRTYDYKVDITKSFDEQKMSEKTKAIFANIFRDYWATDYQRERILAKEDYDKQKREEERRKKYNPDDIFKNKDKKVNDSNEKISNVVAMTQYNESLFKKLWSKILSMLKNK